MPTWHAAVQPKCLRHRQQTMPNNGSGLVCSRRLSRWHMSCHPYINMYARHVAILWVFWRPLTMTIDLFHLFVPWGTFISILIFIRFFVFELHMGQMDRYMDRWPHTKLEKVALDGSVKCCAPPPGWRDLELWPFDPKHNQVISVPRCTSDKSLAKIRQQTLEISRKHQNLGCIRSCRDLDLWPFDPKI